MHFTTIQKIFFSFALIVFANSVNGMDSHKQQQEERMREEREREERQQRLQRETLEVLAAQEQRNAFIRRSALYMARLTEQSSKQLK